MKRVTRRGVGLLLAIAFAFSFAACNVTRTVTTTATSYQRGDTSVIIQSRTIESYDATYKPRVSSMLP